MPWRECYVVRRMPKRLLFANGAVEFEIVEEPWLVDGHYRWVFRARKLQRDIVTCTIAASSQGRWHLQQELAGGFLVEDPKAIRLMERLVREGYATKTREKFGR